MKENSSMVPYSIVPSNKANLLNRGNGVIKGRTEALQLMNTGSKWRLFVPSDRLMEISRWDLILNQVHLIFEVDDRNRKIVFRLRFVQLL
jgi:hypothetical protein